MGLKYVATCSVQLQVRLLVTIHNNSCVYKLPYSIYIYLQLYVYMYVCLCIYRYMYNVHVYLWRFNHRRSQSNLIGDEEELI